jgi:Raf kinase inhibitor-like YbhB/YbcL family protein
MNRIKIILTLSVLLLSVSGVRAQKGGETMNFTISTSAFREGGTIPVQYTCDGSDISPPLKWEGSPAGTKSFAIIMDDPDAPSGTFIHWVIYDIPADTNILSEGLAKDPDLSKGIKQGISSFRRTGYGGPCPPPGSPHRYFFTIYALDIQITGLVSKASKQDVENKIKGHIIGKAIVMGKYGR